MLLQCTDIPATTREQITKQVSQIPFLDFLDIWDTAGQESFNKLHPSYYYGAHACIMVFDATRKITYDNLKIWYTEMRNHCPHIPCIVIANKIDLDPRTTKRSYKYIEDLKVPFNFVSAADGTNVVQIFRDALDLAIDYKKNPPKDDFMADVLELLGDDALDDPKAGSGDELF